MSLSKIPKVYASALLELATEANSLESVEQELNEVISAFTSDEAIKHYFLSPVVDPIAKEKTAHKAISGKASDLVANFITLVVKKNRYIYLADILEAFREGVDKLKNRSSLKIVSKEELSASQKERIISYLSKQFNRELRVSEVLDPAIMGGFKLYVDDYLIDASIRYKLANIEEALLQKKIPVGAMYEN
ncbi:F0F1 ATP synthase subunit delta [Leptospira ryugenii]|uniref:ATP synthase subunit delta n=1 Tax=Leptospira ryugenii TaxID=1917863 RepID=A0A2P2E105_9LEPT|nr:ATP synthase F1 subunit delta [Leptospira ryugenii]GBF50560.1 F0F1 ATP synthase subunit delta [Leptospira ryugenii]